LLSLALGILGFVLVGAWVNSVLSAPPYRGKATAHFNGKRFNNLFPFEAPGLLDVLRWKLTTPHGKWPDRIEFPAAPAPPARVTEGVRITFINHATVLLQLGGLNVLTDPVFSERIGPLGRFGIGAMRHKAPGLTLEQLPRIDVVLVSHNHYDHLDVPSLERLTVRDAPTILTGLGNASLLERSHITGAVELDLWESRKHGNVTCTLTPVQHWSSRSATDRFRSLWGGFYVQSGTTRIYFAGDTGYGPHFEATVERLGAPDIALLPIGAYEPRWFMRAQHMDPDEAVLAHRALAARTSIATHFGCFDLASDGMSAPPEALKRAMAKHRVPEGEFLLLEHGASWVGP
jgi:L-ascorbate metabolism protein UlaG (beta-lactamase superfamily)